jgi:hypothetical protein
MKKNIILTTIAMLFSSIGMLVHSFCGFYVAKADASLFNNKSEVIMVRDGIHNVITMSSDFKGDLKDFAMVVPVPVLLKETDIRVVERNIFNVLNDYSAPRLVEYYDENPCYDYLKRETMDMDAIKEKPVSMAFAQSNENKKFGVTIEAQYSIEEYEVLILSAKESSGLKEWLTLNNYKIPATAEEVLQPYIKSNMKFFVVKVNAEKMKDVTSGYLRPLQLSFDHEKFMLPIRLGMANSQGSQDMIVYGFTRTGRLECTNYRTVKMPTDRKIPLFVKEKFGEFYKAIFEKNYQREGRNAVFLEYAWNVSPYTAVKCDPCVGNPPYNQDFVNAGVSWLNEMNGNATVFFTRLHVRYSRGKFPADLQFQITPNNENFQCRYILTHPAGGEFGCDAAQNYLSDLYNRRRNEVDEMYALAGWVDPKSTKYVSEYVKDMKEKPEEIRNEILPIAPGDGGNSENGSGNRKSPTPFLVVALVLGLTWFAALAGKWMKKLRPA